MLVTWHLHANFYEEVVILYHQGNLLPLSESRHKCSLALVNGCLIRKCAEVISISTEFGVWRTVSHLNKRGEGMSEWRGGLVSGGGWMSGGRWVSEEGYEWVEGNEWVKRGISEWRGGWVSAPTHMNGMPIVWHFWHGLCCSGTTTSKKYRACLFCFGPEIKVGFEGLICIALQWVAPAGRETFTHSCHAVFQQS